MHLQGWCRRFRLQACPTMKPHWSPALPASSAGTSRACCWSAAYRCARWCARAAGSTSSTSNASPAICATPRRSSARSPAAGCVFHVAADYRLWARDPRRTLPLERGRHAQSAGGRAAAGVERVVYTSTVGCIGIPPGGIGDENYARVALTDMAGDYKRSKFLAEQVALEFARGGLAGGDREPHRADRRSRCQAHAHRQDRARFPERRHAGLHRYRAERGGRARRRARATGWPASAAARASATSWARRT